MNAIEIQQDQIYADAYKAAENAFNKKYQKLFNASLNWMHLYESSFGEPDKSCKEFHNLNKILQTNK